MRERATWRGSRGTNRGVVLPDPAVAIGKDLGMKPEREAGAERHEHPHRQKREVMLGRKGPMPTI